MELIDSHTHLDSAEFDADRDAVIERARKAGVTRLLTIGAGDELASAERAIKLAEKHDFIWASAGVHPHDAGKPWTIEALRILASHPRVVAIGETGLDFYKDWSPRPAQYSAFEQQIALAKELKKPLIIHSRNAGSECLEVLTKLGAKEVGGVFHCYAEDEKFAAKLKEINFVVSFPGTLTFKKTDALRAICAAIPIEQILLETDAPYMAPEPHRGKRCESSLMVETAKMLASVKGITLEECARITSENVFRVFPLMRR